MFGLVNSTQIYPVALCHAVADVDTTTGSTTRCPPRCSSSLHLFYGHGLLCIVGGSSVSSRLSTSLRTSRFPHSELHNDSSTCSTLAIDLLASLSYLMSASLNFVDWVRSRSCVLLSLTVALFSVWHETKRRAYGVWSALSQAQVHWIYVYYGTVCWKNDHRVLLFVVLV
jgi:hypothetical protein